jgi:hypothetical protein
MGPWQPLTFSGVAAFAQPARGRLLKVQFGVALFVAACLVWFLAHAWFPPIDQAVAGLPAKGAIRNGALEWEDASPVSLAEGPFLALTVDLGGRGDLGRSADLRVELGRTELRLGSLFGYWQVPCPAGRSLVLNRTDANAWWGAWRTFLLIGAGATAGAGLFASWWLLAIVYAFGVRGIAFYADRQLSTWASLRLTAAALLPGSLMMGVALVLYGHQRLSLLGLLLAWGLHWVVGWIYAALAPFWLPRHAGSPPSDSNPFGPPESAPARRTPASPFSARS